MNLKFGLKPEVIQHITQVIKKYPVERILIYGSRAKGNFREGSDIDLTLVAPKLAVADLLKIENEIDDLLLPYKIDLSLFHQLESEDLLAHIERVGVEFR